MAQASMSGDGRASSFSNQTETGTDYSLVFTGQYLRVHAPACVISPDSQKRLWAAVARACRQHDCHKVLIEGDVAECRMNTVNAFNAGVQFAAIFGIVVAVCLRDFKPGERSTFFKNVAHNRGAQMEFFATHEAALAWLGVEDAPPAGD
ncbi:MAG: hypothetical protein KDE68_06320 [Rhodocyclaceae bacterium]|nr:hypothetical protein [Rhodocyclaceae bacterium]